MDNKKMKATAKANVNIALIKYWGKRDEKLILPHNSSLSITLNNYGTTTTVKFDKKYLKDQFILDNKEYKKGEEYSRVINQLDLVRKIAQINLKAKIVSKNKVETAAGLASSASGAAALAASSAKAAGLKPTPKEISILARQGSGSATRSIHGGFVQWLKGEKKDGSDSYAKQIENENYWPEFKILAVIVSKNPKKIKSRDGMKQTIITCPYYKAWLDTIEKDLTEIKEAIENKNFKKMGEIAEHNCLKMHSLMLTTKPSLIYWDPKTIEIMHKIQELRENDIYSYFTIDAGPQIKILCLEKNINIIKKEIAKIDGIKKIIELKLGKGIQYFDKHLF
jgi:diphosphomevalonate decarboxylase